MPNNSNQIRINSRSGAYSQQQLKNIPTANENKTK